jgi:hypothetical protein
MEYCTPIYVCLIYGEVAGVGALNEKVGHPEYQFDFIKL